LITAQQRLISIARLCYIIANIVFWGLNMLVAGAAILLSMAATSADNLDSSRKAFSNCMRTFHNTAVAEKISISDFREKAKTACDAERGTYSAAIVRSERGFGSSVKDAEAYATEEIMMIVDGTITSFSDNVGEGITLVMEG
jgi:hypothetical protein